METPPFNTFHLKMKHKHTSQENLDSKSKRKNTQINTLSHDSTFILCSSNSISQSACDTNEGISQQTDSLKNNTSLSENPFHLIKTISGGSVSLESIPTISLFKPNAEEACFVDTCSKMDELSDSGALESLKLNTTTILGSEKLPQSIIFYINQQHKTKKLNKDILYLCDENPEKNGDSRKSSAALGESDETEAGDSTPDMIGKKTTTATVYSLQKSDTFILDSDNCDAHSKNDLHCADTIILSHDTDQVKNLNTIYQGNMEVPTALEGISTASNGPFTAESEQLPSLDSTNQFQSADEILKKTVYLMSGDGQLKALSLSPEQAFLASANQVGQFKDLQAKATQTELIFGTENIIFSSMETIKSKDQLCELQKTQVSLSGSSQQTQTLFSQSNINIITFGKPLDDCFVQNAPESKQQNSYFLSQTHSVPCDSLDKNNVPMLRCIECQKEIGSKQELKQHDKNHQKVYQCDLCNAKFTRLGNFTRHRKIHSLQPEQSYPLFKCDTCGREFLQRCDLVRHRLIHTKQEPHRCDKCGKGYIRKSDLVVHLRFHNKDKAFKCKMCDKNFFQTGDLSRHIRRAHKASSQLTCGHCERKYANETTLIRHMKAVHKDVILQTVHQRLQESEVSVKQAQV